MSRQSLVPHRAVGVSRKVLTCRFFPDTANNPTTIYGREVKTVTYNSAGNWTVSFNEAAPRVVGLATGLGLSTLTGNGKIITQIDNEGGGSPLKVVVVHDVNGTATSLAAHTDNWISILVEVEESSAAL